MRLAVILFTVSRVCLVCPARLPAPSEQPAPSSWLLSPQPERAGHQGPGSSSASTTLIWFVAADKSLSLLLQTSRVTQGYLSPIQP